MSWISFPNGTSDNCASFICCRAKGSPMTVIAQRNAKNRCVIAIQRPPISIQITFIATGKHPEDFSIGRTSFPKGSKAKNEILMHWRPKGIPITVKQRITPIRFQFSVAESAPFAELNPLWQTCKSLAVKQTSIVRPQNNHISIAAGGRNRWTAKKIAKDLLRFKDDIWPIFIFLNNLE